MKLALAILLISAGCADALIESAAREPGAVKTRSGMVIRTLRPGSGKSPAADDTVLVNYQGKLEDGSVFESSRDRGRPAELSLRKVIPCWAEGIQRMKVGERATLVCPSHLAYGMEGRLSVVPPGATLTFEVELLAIVPAT